MLTRWLFLGALGLLAINISGQSPANWTPVNLKDCNANIDFPQSPKYSEHAIPSYETKLLDHYYVYENDDSSYSVECGQHPYIADDRDSLKEAYDRTFSPSKFPKEYETPVMSEITLSGHRGRQLEFYRTNGHAFVRVWVFVIGEIRYQVQFIATALVSRQLDSQKELNMKAFFASFTLATFRFPVVLSLEQSFPNGLSGTVAEGLYRNSVFGFSMSVPKDWITIPKERINELELGGQSIIQSDLSAADKARVRMVLVLTKSEIGKDPPGVFSIGVEKQRWKFITQQAVAQSNRDTVRELRGITVRVMKDISSENINGVDFSTFQTEVEAKGKIFFQKNYILLRGAYSIDFQFQSSSEAMLSEMDKYFRSIRFLDPK